MAVLITGKSLRLRHALTRWLGRWLVVPALLFAVTPVVAAEAASREYQLKAIFLSNFAQFVEWPPAAFPDTAAPLVIGVLGVDPFGSILDETVRDEKIGQRPLLVQRYQRAEDITACHILFISESEAERIELVVAHLRNRSILTVSDTEGIARRGIMVRFLTEKNKIRLRINLDAAKAAALRISSKLLRPAEIVTTGD